MADVTKYLLVVEHMRRPPGESHFEYLDWYEKLPYERLPTRLGLPRYEGDPRIEDYDLFNFIMSDPVLCYARYLEVPRPVPLSSGKHRP